MFLLFLASEIKEVRIFMVEERSKGTAEGCGHPVVFVKRHFLILKDTSSPVGPESYVDLSINSPLHSSSSSLSSVSSDCRERRNFNFLGGTTFLPSLIFDHHHLHHSNRTLFLHLMVYK